MFEANDYRDEATIDHIDNFTKGKSRQLDTILTYNGMYGIDNYLVWNIHKNLPNYDFSTVALDLNLFMYKSTDIPYFQDFYRVQDIRYNPDKSQYTLYAISVSTEKLHSKLSQYGVTSLSYKENRTAKQLLIDIIEKNNIFYLRFHDDTLSTENMLHYQYRYFDIDPEWTVLDLIEYIADDNKYEWCITTFVDKETNKPYWFLHIGHELKADTRMNATKKFNIEDDNISSSVYTMKITTNGSPMQPLASWEETLRCLWSKHTIGRGGADNSKGCFAPVGMGHFPKILYLRTLEGEIEKYNGYSMLNKRKIRIPSVGIGNILKDEGDNFIDQVSIQKNPKTYSIREPHNILINRGEDILIQHQLERITRSTPYLDYNAGLLFPSSKLNEGESPPNSLIFNVDGKRESAVLGPFVYGDGRINRDEEGNPTGDPKLVIPIKNRNDLRFRLPNGGEVYYQSFFGEQETGNWIFQAPVGFTFKSGVITEPGEIPNERRVEGEEDSSTITFHDNFFTIEGSVSLLTLKDDGSFWITPKTDESGQNAPKFIFLLNNNDGKITISGDNSIDIEISTEGALSSGTININTTGVVNIGAGASAVNLAGGLKTLAHGLHIHTTGNMGIPIDPCKDNTIKTKAD